MMKKNISYIDLRDKCFKNASRTVIKVGSNVLTENLGLNIRAIRRITTQICELVDEGREIILVSSGAMAAGMRKLNLSKRPTEIPQRQAIAAVGQAGLIEEYEKAFDFFDKKVAQILLTGDDLANRKRFLNARNTINTLLSWKVTPVINENDTVAIEEIKFGDNDNLSAMITLMMDADLLINITDINGLYNKDPRRNKDAELIQEVSTINKTLESYASSIPGALGTGGMMSKIKAAKKVVSAGIPMVIVKEKPDILKNIFKGKNEGTFFVPKTDKMASRKCWIAFTLKPKGILTIDSGAAKAILKNGKSLLPVGILDVQGNFSTGDPVSFELEKGLSLGSGLVNYSMNDIKKIKGLHSHEINDLLGHQPYDEVIHRDNMVIFEEC